MSTLINTDRQPLPGPDGETIIYAVLTTGTIGDYAVYISNTPDTEWTMSHGRKLPYRFALQYFPGLKIEEYRQ